MAILVKNSVFILIPKSRCVWLRKFMHAEFEDSVFISRKKMMHISHKAFKHIKDIKKAAFVRDPVEWYASYWAYRTKSSWSKRGRMPFDKEVGSNDFPTYIQNVLNKRPNYYVQLVVDLIGERGEGVDYVGSCKTFFNDLRFMCSNMDLRHYDSNEVFYKTPPANVSPVDLKKQAQEQYTDAMKEKIAESNKEIYEWFYENKKN